MVVGGVGRRLDRWVNSCGVGRGDATVGLVERKEEEKGSGEVLRWRVSARLFGGVC